MKFNKFIKSQDNYLYINVVVFFSILGVFFILMLFTSNGGYSEDEKRDLATFPSLNDVTLNEFFQGKYFERIDSFYKDNFPYRDTFFKINLSIDESKGIRKDDIKVYN